ncbi:MAG: SMC-Scp complex subunit ScpB [Oscillospiraceae bacterium]|nr:SMC-Scp complex subunit ScpB [Oscillospiraceae bacterium]
MQLHDAEHSIEAILFASGEPVELQKICEVMDSDEKTVKNLIERIRERYLYQSSPFDIVMLGDAYQMCTLPQYAEIIRRALTLRKTTALSQASLEVLAVIAYNQPVTRAFVEQVRGVDCGGIVKSLVDKDLIEEAGRLPIPGKPISYKPTANFLRCFGLENLEQLPELPHLAPETPDDEEAEQQLDGQIDFFE